MRIFAKIVASHEQSSSTKVYSTRVDVIVHGLKTNQQHNSQYGTPLIVGQELEDKIAKGERIPIRLFNGALLSVQPRNLFFISVQTTAHLLASIFEKRGIEPENASVVEVECSYGRDYEALKAIGVSDYTGIDINIPHLLVAQKKHPEVTFSLVAARTYQHRQKIDVAFFQSPYIDLGKNGTAVMLEIQDPHTGDKAIYPYSKASIESHKDIIKNIGSQLSDTGCIIIFFRRLPDYIGIKETVLKDLSSQFVIVEDVIRIDPYTAVNHLPVSDIPLRNVLTNDLDVFRYVVVKKKMSEGEDK
jgi:hypothetical protein